MRRVAIVVALVGPLAAMLASQAPSRRQGPSTTIRGRVIEASSGTGVAGVTVALLSERVRRQVVTDAGGQFAVSDVPQGTYRLTASHKDYRAGGYGQMWPAAPSRPLHATTSNPYNVTIRLWTMGAIRGKVTAADGAPIGGATVQAIAQVSDSATIVPPPLTAATTADGEYRLALSPGRYIIGIVQSYQTVCTQERDCQSRPRGKSLPVGHQSTFYAGAREASEATVVVVTAGEDRSDVDLVVDSTTGVTVSGTVQSASGPIANVLVQVTRQGNLGLGATVTFGDYTTTTNQNGRFVLRDVSPANYVLRTEYRPSTTDPPVVKEGVVSGRVKDLPPSDVNPVLEASLPLNVGSDDVTGYDVTLLPAPAVRGSLQFRQRQSPPAADQLAGAVVALYPTTVGLYGVKSPVDARGGISFPSVSPGRYRVMVEGLSRWILESVDVSGSAGSGSLLLDVGPTFAGNVTLQLTDQPARIAGRVAGSSGAVEGNAVIFLFPADASVARQWSETISVSATGDFASGPLRPGDYMVAALTDAWFDVDWQDPAAIAQIRARATRIHVQERQTATVTLSATSISQAR